MEKITTINRVVPIGQVKKNFLDSTEIGLCLNADNDLSIKDAFNHHYYRLYHLSIWPLDTAQKTLVHLAHVQVSRPDISFLSIFNPKQDKIKYFSSSIKKSIFGRGVDSTVEEKSIYERRNARLSWRYSARSVDTKKRSNFVTSN